MEKKTYGKSEQNAKPKNENATTKPEKHTKKHANRKMKPNRGNKPGIHQKKYQTFLDKTPQHRGHT